MQPICLSVTQAAKALGVGRTTTFALIRAGTLPSIKIGRRTLIPVIALERLVAADSPKPAGTVSDGLTMPGDG